jgi:hypothetical protein
MPGCHRSAASPVPAVRRLLLAALGLLRAAPRHPPLPGRALSRRWAALCRSADAGMSTAEYAVGTVAACAFAAVLYKVVTGGSIVSALGRLITSALATLS